MGLIINQGKQDTSKDNTFEIIQSANELAQIVKIELDEQWENTLKVSLKIIGDSKYKGRMVFDRVSFSGDFSWKYRNLRRCAGVPYTETEGTNVDIEALLLNKAVNIELGIRKGSDGNEYQAIKYKAGNTPKTNTTDTTVVSTEASEEDVVISADDELPW